MTAIKFCGMTRRTDAEHASQLGARYVGAILTESPRRVDADAARTLFASLPPAVRRVAVFGHEPATDIARTANRVGVDVVQLHGDQDAVAIGSIRDGWSGELWWVARVNGSGIPSLAYEIASLTDGIVLDARVHGKLGGTGVPLDWTALREDVGQLRATGARVILAGGLNPDNVRRAVDTLHPDVVDVSSGVESSVGVKDHERMRAFRDAVTEKSTR